MTLTPTPHFLSLILCDLRIWVGRRPGEQEVFEISGDIEADLSAYNPIVQEFFCGARDLLLRVSDTEPGDDLEQAQHVKELLSMFGIVASLHPSTVTA